MRDDPDNPFDMIDAGHEMTHAIIPAPIF